MSLYTMVGGLPLYAVLTMAFALAGWAFAFFMYIYMLWRLAGMDRRSRLKRKNRSKKLDHTERTTGSSSESGNDELDELDKIIAELDAEIAELEDKLGYEHDSFYDYDRHYDRNHSNNNEVKANDKSKDMNDVSKMSKNQSEPIPIIGAAYAHALDVCRQGLKAKQALRLALQAR